VIDYPVVSYVFIGQLRDVQMPIYNEAIDKLNRNHSVLLNLRTGFGKTILACSLMCALSRVTLIVYSFSTLKTSWLESTLKTTNCQGCIWSINDNKNMPDKFSCILATPGMLKYIPEHVLPYIGCLIIDEMHTFCTQERISKLLTITPDYVIGLTATMKRADGMEEYIKLTIGNNIIERSISKDVHYMVYGYNTNIKITHELDNNGVPKWDTLNRNIAESKSVHELVVQVIYKMISQNRKIIVMSWSIDLTEALYNLAISSGIPCSKYKQTDTTYDDSPCVISTIGKSGTGFDEMEVCTNYSGTRLNTIILAGSTKSPQLLEQIVGRIARTDQQPIVIDLIHNNKILENHWKQRCKWYKKHGTVNMITSL
jgi:superfamily II DNA or RNA helicase